jgi:hypothetical protein
MNTMNVVCRWFHPPVVVRKKPCSPDMTGKVTDTICEECMERLDEEDPIYQRNMRTLKKTRFSLESVQRIMVQGYRK